MRRAVIIVLVVALAGCTTVRKGLGAYQKEADKGVTLGDSGRPGGTAPPNSAGENTDTSTKPAGGKDKKTKAAVLPGGLGGDKEHRAYTGDAPPLIPPR
ncbi:MULTISPECIES: hypothetical protein [Sphingosinicellaceae]|uniref:hypothetical protein n=1 Tax=Sphingosinicellaceae TaxID=2820280 RepID=UPI001C1E81CB|nr:MULTISPECIES: hypothetical protein [Polymorphobacter]QYE36538.1 hypothetical protein KZX46_11815 [Polymorphobacter sp. PAMC 29334]UAJ08668.1 hypothetical protein KTC28_09665 [Polymorphobacter megasporae]